MTFRREALAATTGLVSEEVGLALAAMAGQVAADLAIVEIGSFRGRSTCYLAEGARCGFGAHVWAVDPWDLPGTIAGIHDRNTPEVRADFHAQLDRLGLSAGVTAIRGFSVDVAAGWDQPIGMLFVDGDHNAAAVRADVAAWAPHLVAGAVVVFDDYGRNKGVTRAVQPMVGSSSWKPFRFAPKPLAITRRV